MSKRCKLQKEYYKKFGNYKGSGKYTDHYVSWLESKVIAINFTHCCAEFKTVGLDPEIAKSLNEFCNKQGKKEPTKKRF